MLQTCISDGFEKGETLSLGKCMFSIYSGQSDLILPAHRLGLKTYLSYALAEAEWYMKQDRTVDFISQYGPIWNNMTDENGLVNSNYWYQINHNQCAHNLNKGHNTYWIINEENSKSLNDVPCNNVLNIYLNDKGEANTFVLARSIDLIYGLPFDMFAFQGIARKLGASKIGYITFDIIDAHIYKSMLPKLDISKIDNDYLSVPFEETSYHKELGYIDFREKARNVRTKLVKPSAAVGHSPYMSTKYDIAPFTDPNSRRHVNVFCDMVSYKTHNKDGFQCYHYLV